MSQPGQLTDTGPGRINTRRERDGRATPRKYFELPPHWRPLCLA